MIIKGYEIKPYANLQGANLRFANLRFANLQGAYLRRANFRGAYLRYADLQCADLRGANLGGANLRDADLRGADLRGADLQGADLQGADLRGADLQGADLRGANLQDAKLSGFQIDQDSDLIVWKALFDGAIAKLKIPARAKRTASLCGNKCRAEYAEVLAIWDCNGRPIEKAESEYDWGTAYKTGEIVRPDSYDDDIRVECTNGIHFFMTKAEAESWAR